MEELDAEEFEELLRPAFREEEWILIAAGASLGFVNGDFNGNRRVDFH